MSDSYKIKLGVDVDVGDIQSQINSKAKDTSIPVKLEIENIGDIKKQIQGLGVLKGGIEIPLTIDANAAIKSAQQVGQKFGSTATKSVQKSLNIDGLFEKEARALMKEYGISTKSKSGVAAKDEIKKALSGYVNEVRSGGKIINDEFFGSFNTIDTALRKVTDAITKNKKEVIELDSLYEDLIRDIKSINNGKGAVKISLPDMRSEWGDDYSKNKDLLGSWFSEKYAGAAGSIGIDSWVKSKNWSSLLDLSGSHQDIANQLVKLIEKTKTVYSGDELFREGFLKIDDVEARIKESASNITAAEQKMIQSSNSATDTIVQNQQRQQEAIKASLEAKKAEIEQEKKRLAEINKSVDDYNNRFLEASTTGDPNAMEYYAKMQFLEAEGESLKSHIDTLDAAYNKEVQLAQEAANAISQNEERKQQAYRETANSVKSASKGLENDSGVLDRFKLSLQNIGMSDDAIDSVANRIKNLGVQIESLSQKESIGNKEILSVDVSGVDDVRNAITLTQQYDIATGQLIKSVERVATVQQKAGAATDGFAKQQKQAVSNLTNQINQLNRAASDQNASRPIKDSAHLDSLADKYDEITTAIQRMENASSDTFVDEQNNVKKLISEYKSLVSEYRNAENVSSKMKGTDFTSGLDIARNDLEKFKAQAKDFPQITQTIENLDRVIENVGDASSLNKFNDQLRVARSELAKIKSETSATNRSEKVGINVSGLESKIADLQRISPEIDRFEAEIDGAKVSVQSLLSDLRQVNTQGDFSVVNSKWKAFADAAKAAGIAVTETATKAKAALANDIKFDIEVGNFENQMDEMYAKFNRLSDANTDLRNSVKAVENAYQDMLAAANANTSDEVADREKLIQAEKRYAEALEKTNNLIKIQARADKIDADAMKLEDDRQVFQSKIDTWLTKNSAATKEFGNAMLKLKAQAENCDRVTLNHLTKQFTKLDNVADKAGLKMESLGDRIKSKFKEYSAYLSVAEVFMYISQGMRDMFEQVKLVDSAMTELKKVTDESDAAYNQFLSNAASRAQAIGTTIDGLVTSTADFARLGYGFQESQELAEVANIYAVVGDEIDGVEGATESLISTMTAFGVEASNSMSIVDKFNIIGNNFAISSGGIGEALERSASSMAAANNSLDETIALITAANTVVVLCHAA